VILNDSCAAAQQVPKEHCRVQRLKATVAQQQKQIETLTATVQKVSNQLEQKVSGQIALSKFAPQLVVNP